MKRERESKRTGFYNECNVALEENSACHDFKCLATPRVEKRFAVVVKYFGWNKSTELDLIFETRTEYLYDKHSVSHSVY